MSIPKITLKQAEKAVKKNHFKISESGYSKKYVKKADRFERKHGFRYEDAWNLDHAIACFILPRLVQLRDTQHGYPAYFEHNYPTEEEAVAAWDDVLNEMIYGFYIYVTKDGIFGKMRIRLLGIELKVGCAVTFLPYGIEVRL